MNISRKRAATLAATAARWSSPALGGRQRRRAGDRDDGRPRPRTVTSQRPVGQAAQGRQRPDDHAHLDAFQAVADRQRRHPRVRHATGYEASGRYVEHRLKKAGYTTERQYFPFTYSEILGEDVTENSPTARSFENHVMTAVRAPRRAA